MTEKRLRNSNMNLKKNTIAYKITDLKKTKKRYVKLFLEIIFANCQIWQKLTETTISTKKTQKQADQWTLQ